MRRLARHFLSLPIDISLIFRLNFNLLSNLESFHGRPCSRELHKRAIANFRAPEQLVQRMITLKCLTEDSFLLLNGDGTRVDPRLAKTLAFPLDRFAFARERSKASIVDDTESITSFGQAQVGVIFPKTKPIFRTAREHSIRFGHAARNEIVDQHAKIRLMPVGAPGFQPLSVQRSIESGKQSLSSRFLVAGGSIDLAREK